MNFHGKFPIHSYYLILQSLQKRNLSHLYIIIEYIYKLQNFETIRLDIYILLLFLHFRYKLICQTKIPILFHRHYFRDTLSHPKNFYMLKNLIICIKHEPYFYLNCSHINFSIFLQLLESHYSDIILQYLFYFSHHYSFLLALHHQVSCSILIECNHYSHIHVVHNMIFNSLSNFIHCPHN